MSARSKTGQFIKKKEHARRSVVAEVRKSVGEKRKAESEPVTDVGSDFPLKMANNKKKALMPALAPLRAVISETMIGKMAAQGVTIDDLKEEFRLHGAKGIEVCLGVQVNGKPRVTRNKKILEKIVSYMKDL